MERPLGLPSGVEGLDVEIVKLQALRRYFPDGKFAGRLQPLPDMTACT